MKPTSIHKIFLIYMFEFYKEDHVKFFDAILKDKLEFPYHFHEHTLEENEKFLLKWYRKNHIHLCEFEKVKRPKFNKDNVPEFIRRISGTYHNNIDFMGEDRRD